MPEPTTAERVLPWAMRAMWIGVLVIGGRALDSALADSDAATLLGWLGLLAWIATVGAMAVPAVVSLTATRVAVPLAVPVAVLAWIGGADPVDGALFVGVAALTALIAASSALGRSFVQASAYGDEDRHLLRPPLTFGVIAAGLWVVWAALAMAAIVAVTAERPAIAVVVGVVALSGGVFLFPRWHRLSCRWLVLVPAGVVLHDQVCLAETLMVRRRLVTTIGLALAGTDAADLTGGTPGHVLEIHTAQSVTVLLGAASGPRAGTATHLTGFLIAPTRPGRVLTAAAGRNLPVGVER